MNHARPTPTTNLSFNTLQEANQQRAENTTMLQPCMSWSCSDWMLALIEEVGEVANILKKDMLGLKIADRAHLGEEIADIFITGALLANKLGINLSDEIIKKFNKSSAKFKSTTELHPSGSHWHYHRPSVHPFGFNADKMNQYLEDRRQKILDEEAAQLKKCGGCHCYLDHCTCTFEGSPCNEK